MISSLSTLLLEPRVSLSLARGASPRRLVLALDTEVTTQNTSLVLPATGEAWSFAFARKLHGDLKARRLYPLDDQGQTWLVLLPEKGPKGLNGRAPGRTHVASHYGSLLSQVLSSATFPGEKNATVGLEISAGVAQSLGNERASFLVTLLQKSISHRLPQEGRKDSREGIAEPRDLELGKPFSEADIRRARAISDAMCVTRSLINAPANLMTPAAYEDFVRALLEDRNARMETTAGRISFEVWGADELAKRGCGLFLAVGQGSAVPPRLLKLVYEPVLPAGQPKPRTVAIVGKGITFDSGGLDIKGASVMRNMKKDMGGSAAALGTFLSASELGVPVRLTCYLALAENMVSGNAMRPGDVYTAHNGLRVEIDNTDAEGRLVLADTLCIAQEENPDWLVDLATLTGAARVALGPSVDALFTNRPEWERRLVDLGVESGDWVWPLPLVDDYESLFDSSVADFANAASGGHGGAITAALFLRRFVKPDVSWTHIDTYMWSDKGHDLGEAGPTGKCVRLLTTALESYASTP